MTTKIATSGALSPCLVATTLGQMSSSFTSPRDQPFARVNIGVVVLRELRPVLLDSATFAYHDTISDGHEQHRYRAATGATRTLILVHT
jgi:hypothetical protein